MASAAVIGRPGQLEVEAVGGRKLEGLASAMKQHQHTIRRHKSEREEVYRCTVR